MNLSLRQLLKISLLNLSFVAFIGIVLRYKILYYLPFIDQKFLLHGHSHFAFAGWITQTLMVLLVAYLSKQTGKNEFRTYRILLLANLITAYGMLIAFPIQGYGFVSIFFSTLSVFTSYFFTVYYWKDLNKLPHQTIIHYWFKAALSLGVLSSIGTFGLAYMMANKIIHQNWYLAAVYFYLHFQYNGWFFFACMGLLHSILPESILKKKEMKIVFVLFLFSVIPAYFLSTLWLSLPLWLFILIIIASFLQLIAWFILIRVLVKSSAFINEKVSKASKWLIYLSGLALTIKLALQLGSTIPSLSQLAFGFRPIVVAYLHLVLLGVITMFLLGYIFSLQLLPIKKATIIGLLIFACGIFLNEVILMLQGIAAFSYNVIPFANELLLFIAIMLFSGIFIILISQYISTKK